MIGSKREMRERRLQINVAISNDCQNSEHLTGLQRQEADMDLNEPLGGFRSLGNK